MILFGTSLTDRERKRQEENEKQTIEEHTDSNPQRPHGQVTTEDQKFHQEGDKYLTKKLSVCIPGKSELLPTDRDDVQLVPNRRDCREPAGRQQRPVCRPQRQHQRDGLQPHRGRLQRNERALQVSPLPEAGEWRHHLRPT